MKQPHDRAYAEVLMTCLSVGVCVCEKGRQQKLEEGEKIAQASQKWEKLEHCRELMKHDAFVTVWGLQAVSTPALQHSCWRDTAVKQTVFYFLFEAIVKLHDLYVQKYVGGNIFFKYQL